MSVSVSPQLTRMRRVAQEVSEELAKNKDVVGVILVGSVASGKTHEKSDIDLIVISNLPKKRLPSSEFRAIEDFELEIHYNSAEHFQHTFDDEQYRDKGFAWFSANFCMQTLRDGMILQDTEGRLSAWKEKASIWRWRSSEIQPLFAQSRSLLQASQDRLEKGDKFAGLVTLRDAITPLSSALMMRLDLPSYWRPKDQSLEVPQLEDKYPELVRLFYEIHSVRNISSEWLRASLEDLARLMKESCWDQGLQLHMKGATGCLEKGNLVGSLLCARRATYCLGIEILNQRGNKTPRYMFHAPTQLKVIDRTKEQEPGFYMAYRNIHRTQQWSRGSLLEASIKLSQLIRLRREIDLEEDTGGLVDVRLER